ncbi:hypothetical protein ENSA5_18480 [Enhygromyxa salina]|uniref:Uncharacterized protein n=1 Tax=Enhygromyxa salina TaxID=215803 RepID=A0A2S9YCR6_9BACT|nr:hypothetical protein [Enhygromyxa salina]PRQ02910.1 hypothetical protein ENSA5_18480 [Enhygromyxa salina]
MRAHRTVFSAAFLAGLTIFACNSGSEGTMLAYACVNGMCPPGWECLSGYCLPSGFETSGGDGDGDGDDGDGDGDTTTGDGDGDGDGDTTTGDGDCFEAPDPCLQFVSCIAALAPNQREIVEEQYGEGGSCWCGSTDEEAQACYTTCIAELETALEAVPTESACHEESCSLAELDPDQPYGPIEAGECPDWNGELQLPLQNPFGIPGGVCAPACAGLAEFCPDHSQTSAQGSCYLSVGDTNYCVSACYVDSTVLGGNQCQCGARCQPHGSPDGEGNHRGICTFESL